MFRGLRVTAVIPACNEAPAIVEVVDALAALSGEDGVAWIDRIVVADNDSDDGTGSLAAAAGARVVHEPRRGYGAACLAGLAHAGDCDAVLFVDGDRSVYPEQAGRLLEALADGADLVVGSRPLGRIEPGAMTLAQRWGTRLVCGCIRLLWRVPIRDLGPFRVIRREALQGLALQDRAYGWIVEMQIKAIQQGLRIVEVPVDTRRRIGRSKISGTWAGVLGAGSGMLGTLWRLWWKNPGWSRQTGRPSRNV